MRKGQSNAAHLPWLQLFVDVCTCRLGKGSPEQPCMSSSVPRAPPTQISKMLAVVAAAAAVGVGLVDGVECSLSDLSVRRGG